MLSRSHIYQSLEITITSDNPLSLCCKGKSQLIQTGLGSHCKGRSQLYGLPCVAATRAAHPWQVRHLLHPSLWMQEGWGCLLCGQVVVPTADLTGGNWLSSPILVWIQTWVWEWVSLWEQQGGCNPEACAHASVFDTIYYCTVYERWVLQAWLCNLGNSFSQPTGFWAVGCCMALNRLQCYWSCWEQSLGARWH